MSKYIYRSILLLLIVFASCDNANDLLNQYIEDGPIIYAGKVDELETQSGFYRFKVNIVPAEDVNRSYCIVSWDINSGQRDSVRVDYSESNFDQDSMYYFSYINISPEIELQGNIQIYAQNVDIFGNRSLIENTNAYVYGENYVSSLINAQISFSDNANEIIFEPRIGSIGNLVSYELLDGGFSEEVFVTDNRYLLTEAKPGGIVRTKTRYLINETDIDVLEVVNYLETKIPSITNSIF